MSKTAKIWLAVGAALVVLGSILFVGAMATCDWDFTKLSTVTYVTNTYKPRGEFDKISIDAATTEIELVLTDEEACRIVCVEAEKVKHSASVENGTLVIDTVDTRKWYDHICISLGTPKMTVYLPQSEYASLVIETNTGDITIARDFSFQTVEIEGDTSDLDCFASVADTMKVELSTGDIYVDTVTAGRLDLTTDTGDIKICSATVEQDVELETDTGAITLENVVAAGRLSVQSDTGDVRFEGSDAIRITVKTSTGDVSGTLRSEKVFITETSTGRISVPKTATGGTCEITTSTGDINIRIQQ